MKKLVSLILALMLAASLAAFASAEEDAGTYLSVRFVYSSDMDRADDVMEFKNYNARQYAVLINGSGRFTAAKTRVDKITNDLKKVINNEPVTAFMN